jgi:hypothetical protein
MVRKISKGYRHFVIMVMWQSVLCLILVCISGCVQKSASNSTAVPDGISGTLNKSSIKEYLSEKSIVHSLGEASGVTGYNVQTPAYIPEGLLHTDKYVLTKIKIEDGFTYSVLQIWVWPYDSSVTLSFLQDPSLDGLGLGGGTYSEINGLPGLEKYTAGDKPKLSLYWKTSSMAYLVTGILDGPLNEDTLRNIAASVPD